MSLVQRIVPYCIVLNTTIGICGFVGIKPNFGNHPVIFNEQQYVCNKSEGSDESEPSDDLADYSITETSDKSS